MKQVHLIMQGKGGIGKSFVSSLIAQYILDEKKETPICIDTDPINATLTSIKGLNTRHINLMENNRIKESRFDEMMQTLCEEDAHCVVDNGSASFVPMSNYMLGNKAIEALQEYGKKKVVIHSVIAAGYALLNNLSDFKQLAEQLPPGVEFLVWLNEYFGQIKPDGKTFEEMKVYHQHKDRVAGIIRLTQHTSDMFGDDIEKLVDKRLTFREAMESDDFMIMSKQRLKIVQRNIYEQLAGVI